MEKGIVEETRIIEIIPEYFIPQPFVDCREKCRFLEFNLQHIIEID